MAGACPIVWLTQLKRFFDESGPRRAVTIAWRHRPLDLLLRPPDLLPWQTLHARSASGRHGRTELTCRSTHHGSYQTDTQYHDDHGREETSGYRQQDEFIWLLPHEPCRPHGGIATPRRLLQDCGRNDPVGRQATKG